MIKKVEIIYCEISETYELFIDGDSKGSFYSIIEAINRIKRGLTVS